MAWPRRRAGPTGRRPIPPTSTPSRNAAPTTGTISASSSPEDGAELEDLRTYTRHLMGRMEADLGTGLDWVAVNHWNTDNPIPT